MRMPTNNLRFRQGPPVESFDDYGQTSYSRGSRILQVLHVDPFNPGFGVWLDVLSDSDAWHGQTVFMADFEDNLRLPREELRPELRHLDIPDFLQDGDTP